MRGNWLTRLMDVILEGEEPCLLIAIGKKQAAPVSGACLVGPVAPLILDDLLGKQEPLALWGTV